MHIFSGIDSTDLNNLLNCLQAVKKTYEKNEIIFDVKDKITSVCLILEGKVQLSQDDYEGNKIIISNLSKDETFGEAFVCAGIKESSICATAIEHTEILFLNLERIMSICSNSCPFHRRLLENIIKIIAAKNIFLQERIEALSKKTLRERVLNFLHKNKPGAEIFEIPFSREQLAQYLGADRSALSRELSKMKKEKIIDYHKNSFKLF